MNPDEARLGGGGDAGTDTGIVTGDTGVVVGDADTGVPPSDTSVPPMDTGVPPDCEFDRRCDGGELLVCDGGDIMRIPCRLGCTEAGGTASCGSMIPSNVDADLWVGSAEDLEIDDRLGIDTSECRSDSVMTTVVPQPDAPELCVISVAAFRIREGASLRAFGGRPLVIMATDEVRIDGVLDVSATGGEHGAGGFRGGTGGGTVELWNGGGPFGGGVGAHEGAFDDGGGGGGGLCGDGGDGGAGGGASGGSGGGTVPMTWELSPLFGGSGGGRGRGAFFPSGTNAGFGGAGGGALQISSPVRIRLSGSILAGGGGGLPGRNLFGSTQNWGSGGGGGSGGAVLLEAPDVDFEGGQIIAAGGGGGGGGGASDGEPGEDGRGAGLRRANGGLGDDVRGAAGGDGSSATSPGGRIGDDNLTDNGNGGGGGGGAGCVLIRTDDASVGGTSRAHPSVDPGYRELRVLTP